MIILSFILKQNPVTPSQNDGATILEELEKGKEIGIIKAGMFFSATEFNMKNSIQKLCCIIINYIILFLRFYRNSFTYAIALDSHNLPRWDL